MANGEREDYDRQPRWNTVGYWTPQREGEDWPGDRSRARDYSREDMRRYGRRAVERGQELRRMRGQGRRHEPWDSQLDTDQVGVHMEHTLDLDRYRDQDWGYDRDYRPRNQSEPGGQRRRNEGAPAGRREYQRPRQRAQRPSPQPERNRGRQFYRSPGRGRFQEDRDRFYPPDRRPGENLVDNYWGRREMSRDYRIRDRDAWWNNAGGRPDFTSARYYRSDIPTRPDFDWIEDTDYDMDPGYEYEFGTDFDMLDQFDQEVANRYGRGRRVWGRDLWEEEPNYQPDPREIEGGFEYGWQGPPDHQRYRYREVWNLPYQQRPRRRW